MGWKCSVGLNEGKNTLEPFDERNPTLTFLCKQHLWIYVRKQENREKKTIFKLPIWKESMLKSSKSQVFTSSNRRWYGINFFPHYYDGILLQKSNSPSMVSRKRLSLWAYKLVDMYFKVLAFSKKLSDFISKIQHTLKRSMCFPPHY